MSKLVKDIEEMNKYEDFEQEEYSPGFTVRCTPAWVASSKMMAGFYRHRFVPSSFSEENLEMA